jgi:uncharacterized tellurite resistance protein B-like protein
MEKVNTPELVFYQNLGELFYAVAAADGIVREAEYKELTRFVEEEWKTIDAYEDAFGTDAAYQISIVFEWFDYEGMDANDCFESFSNYYKEHTKLFSEKRKKLILKTAQKIADSFSGINKSELIMIAKLQLLLKK